MLKIVYFGKQFFLHLSSSLGYRNLLNLLPLKAKQKIIVKQFKLFKALYTFIINGLEAWE